MLRIEPFLDRLFGVAIGLMLAPGIIKTYGENPTDVFLLASSCFMLLSLVGKLYLKRKKSKLIEGN